MKSYNEVLSLLNEYGVEDILKSLEANLESDEDYFQEAPGIIDRDEKIDICATLRGKIGDALKPARYYDKLTTDLRNA